MGNQLVAYAPSLIRPVEYYLTDVPDLAFDLNLGSTRFLKVCRSRQGPLLVVVKVFVIHEHTLPIKIYCDRLQNLRNALSLSPSPNCLPYTKTIATEKSVIVIRPYVKYSLYDRMSTRPFIQWSEKLWIAFQLLCGLGQLHKHNLCHGDLKLENILITPGLRLLLCDFAPFKPVYLPYRNPSAIFGFFFDTAGRRCCYVAPERFHDDKSRLGADNLLTQEDELRHFLLPSMDIFSAGCCLIELFTEGGVPFDLSQLLSFCTNDYDPTQLIKSIEDPSARELVSHMIQRDPSLRSTAQEYLTKFRGVLFPEMFYSTVQSYFDILALQPLSKPDARMARLRQDIADPILWNRNLQDENTLSLIFTSLVTAEVRGLKSVPAKLYALECFRILSKKLKDECVLERVVPYIVFLLQDPMSPRVRAEALTTLVECLDYVQAVPPSDFNIFSGYIFPALERLDRDVSVRISMARNISQIAQISMRYLEASFVQDPEGHGPQQPQFVNELHSQRETIAVFLANILSDSDSVVKRVLVSTPGSIEGLCTYFGRVKAHDILLSHLITFLNDKDDWHLRVAFFRCVPAVASFIGWHAAPLLIPLLKQGLSDVEEYVMREALITIKSLAEINFFGHRFLLELLEEVLPFVIHPNLWLRNASVGVIASIKSNLSEVDVHCHVIPRLKMYLKPSSNAIWGLNEVSILTKARKPLDRQVYESCARTKSIILASAVEFLQNSNERNIQPDSNEVSNFITRLRAEGLPSPVDAVYTSFILKHLTKVNAQRSLRATSNEGSVFPIAATKGIYSGFTQQQLQSQLLIMSTQPIKELMYPGSSSAISSSDAGMGSMMSGTLNAPAFNRNLGKPPAPQHHANFPDKPRGILVAHLHEHSSSVSKICPLTTVRGLFASVCRTDVRIWDAGKMEGKNVANRSRCHIRLPGEKNITNMTYAYGGSVIGITDDKALYGFAVENLIAKNIFTVSLNNQSQEVGLPVALESYSPYLMIMGTELGALLGFDTRAATKEVFRLQSDLKWGLLSSMCFDEEQNWMCTGTSKGILTCWDLRFAIPVNTIKTDSPVRRLKPSPLHPSGVFSAPRCQNEASLWNLETGSRHVSLWASSLPPLSKQQEAVSASGVSLSMFGMTFVKSHNAVITAGSDMCMRWWDLNDATDSFILVNPEKPEQPITGSPVKYGKFRFQLVDGVEVIHDVTGTGHNPLLHGKKFDLDAGSIGSSASSTSSSGTGHSYHYSNAHHNVITDLATVATPNQSFIISASADGVVKVWK